MIISRWRISASVGAATNTSTLSYCNTCGTEILGIALPHTFAGAVRFQFVENVELHASRRDRRANLIDSTIWPQQKSSRTRSRSLSRIFYKTIDEESSGFVRIHWCWLEIAVCFAYQCSDLTCNMSRGLRPNSKPAYNVLAELP